MPKPLAALLGLVLGLGGLVHLAFGLLEWARDRRLMREGVETAGEVVDQVTYPDGENLQSGSYRFVARYRVEGREYRVASRFAGTKDQLLGRLVAVVYDPRDPARARFKNDRGLLGGVLGPALFVLAMAGLFLYGMG